MKVRYTLTNSSWESIQQVMELDKFIKMAVMSPYKMESVTIVAKFTDGSGFHGEVILNA